MAATCRSLSTPPAGSSSDSARGPTTASIVVPGRRGLHHEAVPEDGG
jgi:hypothetical protein